MVLSANRCAERLALSSFSKAFNELIKYIPYIRKYSSCIIVTLCIHVVHSKHGSGLYSLTRITGKCDVFLILDYIGKVRMNLSTDVFCMWMASVNSRKCISTSFKNNLLLRCSIYHFADSVRHLTLIIIYNIDNISS